MLAITLIVVVLFAFYSRKKMMRVEKNTDEDLAPETEVLYDHE